jgi:hypothetical protein
LSLHELKPSAKLHGLKLPEWKFLALKPRDPKLPELSLCKLSLHELKRSGLKPSAKLHGLKLPEWKFLVSKNQLPSYEQQKK